jgi:hypothetical protein
MISSVGTLHSNHSGTEVRRNPSVRADHVVVVSVAHMLEPKNKKARYETGLGLIATQCKTLHFMSDKVVAQK